MSDGVFFAGLAGFIGAVLAAIALSHLAALRAIQRDHDEGVARLAALQQALDALRRREPEKKRRHDR